MVGWWELSRVLAFHQRLCSFDGPFDPIVIDSFEHGLEKISLHHILFDFHDGRLCFFVFEKLQRREQGLCNVYRDVLSSAHVDQVIVNLFHTCHVA